MGIWYFHDFHILDILLHFSNQWMNKNTWDNNENSEQIHFLLVTTYDVIFLIGEII